MEPDNDVHSENFQSKLDPYFAGGYKAKDYTPYSMSKPPRQGDHHFVSAKVIVAERRKKFRQHYDD